MCIRDRYQRRVHGIANTSYLNQLEKANEQNKKAETEQKIIEKKSTQTKSKSQKPKQRHTINKNQEEMSNSLEQSNISCLLYTSPSPRDVEESRMPSSA
eukprot:TRINITY_DN1846_c0_g1_i2.p2 TRINITY_DN1846_c0_g1~~TRINITY_DN1846_c0_g1_i2.p2  ORF type:complete len:113 (-),score=73.75 TRINITY_DN1846_c0_g1_i2:14-310(-)